MAGNVDELGSLPPLHRKALKWFDDQTGQEIAWPVPLDGLYLLNKAKGIHKPAGWEYALSVRQSLGGTYTNKEVIYLNDGSWIYDYFQEGSDASNRDADFTNRALLRNMEHGVPVAVVRQVKAKPSPRYQVLGLAYIESWNAGYFRLRSFNGGAIAVEPTDIVPTSLIDARRRIDRAIVVRQGAGAFRAAVLAAFNSRCVVTGYDVVEGLEAAHIVPYLGEHTNKVTNALLLRADLHTLFDRGLLDIDPDTMRVVLSTVLHASSISEINNVQLNMPSDAHRWRASLEKRKTFL